MGLKTSTRATPILALLLLALSATPAVADDEWEHSWSSDDEREYSWSGSGDGSVGSGGDAHASIQRYDGPQTCLECHQDEALEMHGSVHYQQNGPTVFVDNIGGNGGEGPAGIGAPSIDSAIGINTYCGTHDNSPRFTCAGCHVGNGRYPKTREQLADLSGDAELQELANIDCLMCHQEAYKRFPDPAGGFEHLTLENLCLGDDGKLKDPREPDTVCADSPDADGSYSVVRNGLSGTPIPDENTHDFQFVPADPTNVALNEIPASLKMTIDAVTAARTVHPTTRKSCLNCHAGAGGGDGTKRGDLYRALADNVPVTLDYHMSAGGANKTCSDCHDAGGHRVRGRGLDLRPNDVAERFTCESCHEARPHGDYSSRQGARRDTHAAKIACQTCHIPRYAKAAVGTEVARDWQDPHPSDAACNGRGGWLPREDKGYDLVPTYTWFDGYSEVHYLSEPVTRMPTIALASEIAGTFVGGFTAGEPAYVLGAPAAIIAEDSLGNTVLDQTLGVTNPGAKLYPMKEHWGKLALDLTNETLVGHSTFEFFRTGSFCRAVAKGLGKDPDVACNTGIPGTEMPAGTDVAAVHTFQTINHGVEPEDNALACGACHSSYSNGGPVRMDLQGELGYQVKGNYDTRGARSDTCVQCHEAETKNEGNYFYYIHDKHVRDKGKDCSVCHSFSRPERRLSTSISRSDD